VVASGFDQAGGRHTVSGNLAVSGTYSLADGVTWAQGAAVTGPAAVVQQGGGTFTVASALEVGGAAPGSGRYALSGGVLEAPRLNVNPGGTLTAAGGSLHVADLQSLGRITVTGDTTLEGSASLRLHSVTDIEATLFVNGALNARDGAVTGVGAVVVGATGYLGGRGSVDVVVDNAGTVEAKSGNLVIGGDTFTNRGLVRNAVGASLFVESPTVAHTGGIEVNAAGAVVFDRPVTNAPGQQVDLKGGALGTPTLTNASGATMRGFGTVTGKVVNQGEVDLFGPSAVVGDLDNQAGAHFVARNDRTLITGHTVNEGTIETVNGGSVVFEGGLTQNGALTLDHSVITVTTLRVGANGYLAEAGAGGDGVIVQGDLINASVRNDQWLTERTALQMNGGPRDAAAAQLLEVAGADLGNRVAGWSENFAFGALQIGGSATYVQLVDAYDNSATCPSGVCAIGGPEALYVGDLLLAAGATLDLNGFNPYVRERFVNLGGVVLGGSVSVGAVPLPGAAWLFAPALAALGASRRRRT
jgi:hypothetical protein